MASVPTPPKSIKNAGATQAVAQFVVGETAPDLTTMDTMATLKLLKDVLPAEHHGLLNGVINVETKFLRTALHMLANNKALRDKFGMGLGAAMALASMVREMHAKKIFDKIMGDSMNDSGAAQGLESITDRVNALNMSTSVLQAAVRSEAATSGRRGAGRSGDLFS